jgi:hypothetical protein
VQVNICPHFIVTQLAQREPPGRIISVIVADRGARNSALPATSTLGIIITLLLIALFCLLLQITELALAAPTAALRLLRSFCLTDVLLEVRLCFTSTARKLADDCQKLIVVDNAVINIRNFLFNNIRLNKTLGENSSG